MAKTQTALMNELRNEWTQKIFEILKEKGEDVVFIKDNVLCFPAVDSERNDRWVRIPIEIPKGTKDEPFDGYALSEDFEFSKIEKEKKAKEKAEAKAKKIESDKRYREAKAKVDAKIKERRGD